MGAWVLIRESWYYPFQAPGTIGEFIMAEAGDYTEEVAPLWMQAAIAIHHLVACHGERLSGETTQVRRMQMLT